jgi:hypothetical protein
MNYVTEGLVVLCPEDYEFETYDGKLIHWSPGSETYLVTHHWYQADLYKPGSTIVKFDTGILLKSLYASRILCLLGDYEPLDPQIKVMTAVFPLLDVWSPLMMNTIWPNGHHKLSKGDPLARVFVSYAGEFEYEYAGETDYFQQTKEWMDLKGQPNVLTTFNREMKKCPFHNK